MKKVVLVTGATGFIGRHALQPLVSRGFEVHALYHTESLNESRVSWHHADLADEKEVARIMQEVAPTHLLHFAWIATPGVYWTSPENQEWVGRTLSLLKSFRKYGGTRAVIAGTCAEYDWRDLPELIPETAPQKPATLYGSCKAKTRELSESYAKDEGLSLAWGRIFLLFGPHEGRQRLVPSVITSLLAGEEVRTTSGEQVRDFLFVSDVADAFCALLDSSVEGAVNIGSGKGVSVKGVVTKIADMVGRPELVRLGALPPRADDTPRLVADITRLSKEVEWKPHFSLEEGLKKTIAWWQARRE